MILTHGSTTKICDDKYALYDILKHSLIPVIEHNILFRNEEHKLEGLFYKYGKDVVLKSNEGTCGNEVFHIQNLDSLKEKYRNLQVSNFSMSLCPYYKIKNEYRIIYLDGIKFMYKKQNAVVYGDGKSSTRELLLKFNPIYFKRNYIDIAKLTTVPKLGERIEYDWRFNLSKGAIAEKVDSDDIHILEKIARDAADVINLRIGSIDIIKNDDGEFKIIEINSGLMMENFADIFPNGDEIVYNIYSEAIKKMLEN